MDVEMGRRELLAAGGAGALGAFGGFFANDALEPEPPKEPQLGLVDLDNRDDVAHDVTVVVRIADELVHWDTHHIDAGAGNADEPVSLRTPADRRGFAVLARLEDGTTAWANGDDAEMVAASSDTEPGCFWVKVRITAAGGLELVRYRGSNDNCEGPEFSHD